MVEKSEKRYKVSMKKYDFELAILILGHPSNTENPGCVGVMSNRISMKVDYPGDDFDPPW